jgi:hypothetical protein
MQQGRSHLQGWVTCQIADLAILKGLETCHHLLLMLLMLEQHQVCQLQG